MKIKVNGTELTLDGEITIKELLILRQVENPASPSRPSEEDKRLAYDPEVSYLILSLEDKDNPVLKSFQIKQAEVFEEELQII